MDCASCLNLQERIIKYRRNMFASANFRGPSSISTCVLAVVQALWLNAIVAYYLSAESDGVKLYQPPMEGIILLWEKIILFWDQTFSSAFRLSITASLKDEGVVPVIFLN